MSQAGLGHLDIVVGSALLLLLSLLLLLRLLIEGIDPQGVFFHDLLVHICGSQRAYYASTCDSEPAVLWSQSAPRRRQGDLNRQGDVRAPQPTKRQKPARAWDPILQCQAARQPASQKQNPHRPPPPLLALFLPCGVVKPLEMPGSCKAWRSPSCPFARPRPIPRCEAGPRVPPRSWGKAARLTTASQRAHDKDRASSRTTSGRIRS